MPELRTSLSLAQAAEQGGSCMIGFEMSDPSYLLTSHITEVALAINEARAHGEAQLLITFSNSTSMSSAMGELATELKKVTTRSTTMKSECDFMITLIDSDRDRRRDVFLATIICSTKK